MLVKKYVSFDNLSLFLDNLRTFFSPASHTHSQSDITDLFTEFDSSEPAESDIPKVFITGPMPTTKDNVLAEMTYISNTLNFNSYIEIKCQGTSSMKYPKKNYTVKLYDDDERTRGLYWNGEAIVSSDYAREKFEDMTNGRQGNLLYKRLEQNFYEELQARWAELKNGALSLTNIINKFERFTDAITSDLIKEDYASTTAGGNYTGIPSVAKNNIQQIRNFAADRQSWTDDYFKSLTPIVRIPCTNIALSATEIVFNGEGSQTLVATVEPTTTTDEIIWTTNNSSVATVNNGVITAVFNVEAIITATCGEFSATCAVSVSGIEEPILPPEEPDETLLYSLPSQTVFDGTNYIDTGVSVLAEDTPFTILVDWTHTGESAFAASKYVILHCMNEVNPYPGLVLQYSNTGLVSEFRQSSNISSNSQGANIANTDLFRAKVIYRKAADGTITVSRCYNENGQIHTNKKQVEYVAVSENVRLGCYQTTTGGTGRFAKGIMNDCKIYNYALSDEDVNILLTSV